MNTVKPNNEVIKHWLETINEEGRGLSKWELDFVDSVTEQIGNRSLSERQVEIIERIYAEKTPC